MRIIGGEYRSRKLITPKDDSITRPIPDRVKESLFGLLRGHCEGASVLDAFAGTGALGLEAISRGAARCVFVERSREIADILERNIEALGAEDRCEVVIGDALGPGALARAPRPLNLAFFDPPYPLVRDSLGWKRVKTQFERVIDLLTPDGFAMLRTPWPFQIEIKEESPAAPEAAGRGSARPERRRRGDRPRRRDHEEWTEDAEQIRAWTEQDGEDGAGDEEASAEQAKPRRIPGELALANAEGPETHVYHATAVHLYMRRRSAEALR
jgi:16S rRNA (guanine(966)-N(2))-methyltransferase RsmD